MDNNNNRQGQAVSKEVVQGSTVLSLTRTLV